MSNETIAIQTFSNYMPIGLLLIVISLTLINKWTSIKRLWEIINDM